MSKTSQLLPIDWYRYRALVDAFDERRLDTAARLLQCRMAWSASDSKLLLERLEATDAPLGMILVTGLTVLPERYVEQAVPWLVALEPEDREGDLALLSAAARPLRLPFELEILLGLFSVGWRRAIWEDTLPARIAPSALTRALGGLESGLRVVPPEEGWRAAAELAALDVERYPEAGLGFWLDGLDREGGLDDLCRQVLRDIVRHYRVAGNAGIGMQVLV